MNLLQKQHLTLKKFEEKHKIKVNCKKYVFEMKRMIEGFSILLRQKLLDNQINVRYNFKILI